MRAPNPQPRSGDIVIRCLDNDSFEIVKVDGERIGSSSDRVEAMRAGCEAARVGGSYVWISVEGATEAYREVLCP